MANNQGIYEEDPDLDQSVLTQNPKNPLARDYQQ